MASPEEEAIDLLAERLGADMHLTGQSLSVRGRSLTLPPEAGDRLHDRLPSAFPSPAHGDQREKLDVLLSDIAMPGEDGYALIAKVRSLPAAHEGKNANEKMDPRCPCRPP